VADWCDGVSASCTAGPTVHKLGQCLATQCAVLPPAHASQLPLARL